MGYFIIPFHDRSTLLKKMEDEDVVLENSPLQKYLNEIGYVDFEDTNGRKRQEEFEKSNHGSVWTYKDCLVEFSQTVIELARYIYSSSLSLFVLVPSVNDIETFRNDYIMAVYESQTLKKDDISFLSQFDPKLFVSAKAEMASGFGEWKSFAHGNYILSLILLVISLLLVKIDGLLSPSVLAFLVILFASSARVLLRYFFIHRHQTNLVALKRFAQQTKQLTLLVKRSIKFIQEIELTSKGYTMVGPMMPAFFSGDSENLAELVIFPTLRKNIMENTEPVLLSIQNSAKELLFHFPLPPELTKIFTYFSTGSIGNLHVGIKEIVPDDSTEKVSLQGLKNVASLLSSLQSEFLSRFLLCLSLEVNDGNLNQLYIKLFKNIEKIFGISLKMIECSVVSIERCYHVHESYCFMSKECEKPPVKPCVDQTARALDITLCSIQRHLQVGILRVESIQKERCQLLEPKGDHDSKAKNSLPLNLETAFKWIKSDLESALTCWQEGEELFNKLLGKEPTANQNKVSCDTKSDEILEESQNLYTLDLKEDVEEGDKVYEAFSDPYEEVMIDQKALNVEDVEKEQREARENKRLLQELKTVLLSKAKDPLIGTAGFVQPAVKQPTHNLLNVSNTDSKTWPHGGQGGLTTLKEDKTKICFNLRDSCHQKWLSSNEAHSPVSCIHANEHPVRLPSLLGTFPSSVAVSVAAAAAAHSRAMGLNEESFFSDDTD